MNTSTNLYPVSTQPINPLAQEVMDKVGFVSGMDVDSNVSLAIRAQVALSIKTMFNMEDLKNVMIQLSTDVKPGSEGSCGAIRVSQGILVQLKISANVKGLQLVHVVNHELHHLAQYLMGTTWNVGNGWMWKGGVINATSWANDPGEMDAEINAYRITLDMIQDGPAKSLYIKTNKRKMRMYSKDLAKWEKKNCK